MSFVVTIVFRTDALQWVLTIASGLGAVVLGLWLIVRPNTAIVPGSIAVGIAWLIIFALLPRHRPANSSRGQPMSSLRSSESRLRSSPTQP